MNRLLSSSQWIEDTISVNRTNLFGSNSFNKPLIPLSCIEVSDSSVCGAFVLRLRCFCSVCGASSVCESLRL